MKQPLCFYPKPESFRLKLRVRYYKLSCKAQDPLFTLFATCRIDWSLFSKIRRFRSFHKFHIMYITKPLKLRHWFLCTVFAVASHQSLMQSKIARLVCWGRIQFSQDKTWFQTAWAKGQSKQRYLGALQRAQETSCGHPRRARLSAVRTLSWMRIQANTLHLFSVLARQIRSVLKLLKDPIN